MSLIDLCERGLVPDALVRLGIRRLCRKRLRDEGAFDLEQADRRFRELILELRNSPIAIETAAANEQHYEVPTAFFQHCLGRRLKYSSCYYPKGDETLDQAESAMLELYGERAGLADGQAILGFQFVGLGQTNEGRDTLRAISAIVSEFQHAMHLVE